MSIITKRPSLLTQTLLLFISFLVVAFGQPAFSSYLGLAAAAVGYGLFWYVLIQYERTQSRFWLAFAWAFCIQLVQLAWFISHPYWYIFAVYFTASAVVATQFGILGMFITQTSVKNIGKILCLASIWTLFEFSRLHILSGLSWNPAGLALTGNIYSLQAASLAGIFGLTFWIFLTNLIGIKTFVETNSTKKIVTSIVWIILIIAPYVFGVSHLEFHKNEIARRDNIPTLNALLVQTAFPIEEAADSPAQKNLPTYVLGEWRRILELVKKHKGNEIDLIALPEFVVPFGTYAFVFPLHEVQRTFYEVLGPDSIGALPPSQTPYVAYIPSLKSSMLMADNAYWLQGIANYFQAHVIAGLEDAEDTVQGKREYYSSAMLFSPQLASSLAEAEVLRYEKRVLVPMGEYIPFEWCRTLAASYGVGGSFTPGRCGKSLPCKHTSISPSICYEETFAHLMREGRQKGAEVFVNLTSDVWYPNSRLPRQHFDHAKARTVENGVPLIRACNTGITSAIDSLGREIAILGRDHPEEVEWEAGTLLVSVPLYTYSTFYTKWGDYLIIGISLGILSLMLGWYAIKKLS